jgi:hypothetical protein
VVIKKHVSGNEYINASGVWVRNFTSPCLSPLQLTGLFPKEDYDVVLKNEEMNKNRLMVSDEKIVLKRAVIVSDGYDFEKRHLFLASLPKDIAIFAVNKAYRKWMLMNQRLPADQKRTINAFVVNNPYQACANLMSGKENKYYPTCLASLRTNWNFLKAYPGQSYCYCPTREKGFGISKEENYTVDDYRNPICAAIGLAYRFGIEKLLLLCCDDAFERKRESSVQLKNGLHTYPQQLKSHEIIDANLYWLKQQKDREVKIASYSSGPECVNANYIKRTEDVFDFFEDQQEGTRNVQ